MKRLRILHLDSGATWRGGQRQVLLLALGLREEGHEQFLIGSPGSPLVEKARAAGLAVAAIPMAADWDVRAARRIRARMRAWNVDLVHAHDARSHALAMIALLGRNRMPLVVTRRVAFTPRSARVKYGPRVTRFIAISNAVRDAMTHGGVDPARISVVHSGIALPTATGNRRDWRAELGWASDSVVAGIVGAMTSEKGVDQLESLGESLDAATRSRLRLVLLGGTRSPVTTVGGVTAHSAGFVNDIEPAMAGLDMLIHPSRSEGLGTSIIDAMALGVPPVAFAVGGIPEVIEHEVSGILVPAGDVRSMAKWVARLAGDPLLRERLGNAAASRAQTFDASRMTKETEAVYNRALSG
ncbi:MAG TPA: glycosyltransferase family 4 protein [Gemmatimonadaceae bacterium]